MTNISLDDMWVFRRGFLDSMGIIDSDPGEAVNLPHDGMIGTEVSKDAPAGVDSGFFNGDVCSYTRYVNIPKEWEKETIGLKFDGVMMHCSIDVNGFKIAEHHYGYTPFSVDISDVVYFGEENRITINSNTGIQPSSRWYTGSGLFRSVTLCHSPKVHIKTDGVYIYTKEVSDDMAFLEAQVDICNDSPENRLVEVKIDLSREDSDEIASSVTRVIQVNASKEETTFAAINLPDPAIWDVDTPNLYNVKVTATGLGVFKTHFIKDAEPSVDEVNVLFGVRTISVDAVRGLRINGKTVKLKGGCIHHDNGLLGAVSLYESEARKIRKLKEVGFNAIRTAHNPPSAALVEACDREGMYIFDEAFDAWGIGKRVGDFNQHFEEIWQQELTAFIKRDRIHPSVIMWSTGNEIPERGGLNNGYTLSTMLSKAVKALDGSRPVSNGICSFWSGLDDCLAIGQNLNQNAPDGNNSDAWERRTEPFTNGMDVVGYNYMEELYERDHEMYPERVILGSENFPKEIGFHWPMIERLPYVIGDFTWTAWDYLGEAGIGKSIIVEKDDPLVERKPWELMPSQTSPYPWRLADDADFDITGRLLPQGAYRSVVWGSKNTYLYTIHPENIYKAELMSMWGFPAAYKSWNYVGFEKKPAGVLVFSNAEEVEIVLNGKAIERKKVVKDGLLPNSVRFDIPFEAGEIEAVSYTDQKEISRDLIRTSKKVYGLRLIPEKAEIEADGHDVAYVNIDVVDEDGVLVADAEISLKALLEGPAYLAGFGTGRPATTENYTDSDTLSFNGHATAIVRSTYEKGDSKLTVSFEGGSQSIIIKSV